MARYGQAFKDKAVARLLPPESAAIETVGRELSISVTTRFEAVTAALDEAGKSAYRPEFPVRGFADLEAARTWGHDFVRWYNCDHRHSGIRYFTPAQRHAGEDNAILAARHLTYLQAREGNPAHWSGNTRDWSPIGVVTLSPERDAVIRDLQAENKTRLVA